MDGNRHTGFKRMMGMAAAMALTASLAACGGEGSGSARSVGVQFCTESNAWCAAWLKAFNAEMSAAGVKTTVLTSAFNQAEDNQHIGQLVAKKPDVLVMGAADGNAAIPAIERAAAAGVKLVNVVGPLPAVVQKSLTANVRSDNPALGRFAAQNLVAGLKEAGYAGGNVVVLSGTQSSPTVQETLDGFKKELANSPEYKIVSIQDAQWDPQKSQQMASQLLAEYNAKDGVQGIYAYADYMAAGAIRAVKQTGKPLGASAKDGVIVVASNCSPEGPALLRAGELYGSATSAPSVEAKAAAKVVMAILNGQPFEKNTFVKEEKITRSNVAEFAGVCEY
ncbi:sugar ABC transporter substrate-binding protein [Actinomadura madurae]|uniref:sugar ABC transporter substrate-binding protein n=1 Tax=Actinomadura madurae TaxID=1993 RepID=UPI002026B67D|nr:sugar ABC transporter substrate-binding protein [Actinomadura madurae]MCP9950980.1 sugar ABC transporter substrate-binding protein [Actinomadura madurae]MCP9967765.1 sugar ABC transporter substrate-binding protein [Actinomadura madurae]MCP9980216.1 sugar ABC transporter substrate-binding protein [Actinomadura madurae]MCQ0008261.1 sugar ABC transporter substrate-binding protein [Actinomadura madurae]MCQ0016425.1 sugar ABC transporter substrate-binding protein [Actinomadura madurae]